MAPPKAGKRVRRTPRTLEGKVEKKRRGFERGGANVRALHLEHRATKKAEKMAAARKRKLTLRTKYGAQHAAVTGQAVRAKISPRGSEALPCVRWRGALPGRGCGDGAPLSAVCIEPCQATDRGGAPRPGRTSSCCGDTSFTQAQGRAAGCRHAA